MKSVAVLSGFAALAIAAPRGFPPPITRDAAFPSYNPGPFPTGGSLPPMPTGTGFPGGFPWPSIGSGALPTGAFPEPTGDPFKHHHHHEGGAPFHGAHFPSGSVAGADPDGCSPPFSSASDVSAVGLGDGHGSPPAPNGDPHGSDGVAPQDGSGNPGAVNKAPPASPAPAGTGGELDPGLGDAGFHDEHHHHHHHFFPTGALPSGGFPMPTGGYPPFPSGGFPMPSGAFPFSGLPSGAFPMPTGHFHHFKPTRTVGFATPSPDHV